MKTHVLFSFLQLLLLLEIPERNETFWKEPSKTKHASLYLADDDEEEEK